MRPQDAIQHLRSRRPVGLTIALIVFLVAFALRYSFGNELYTVPFITLFPAILISALIGGLWIGVVVAILSAIAPGFGFSHRPQPQRSIGLTDI
jgi:hypothetical protein